MADQTLASLTSATAATGGLFYGTQSGADRKFTLSAVGAAVIEATTAAGQRTALAVPGTAVANIFSVNGAASTPAIQLTGTVFTGGTGTTTKPLFLIEPSGTTSTGWSTSGTLFGVNAASGSSSDLINLQLNAADRFKVTSGGLIQITSNDVVGYLGSWTGAYGTMSFYMDGSASFKVNRHIYAFGDGMGIGAQSDAGVYSGAWYASKDTQNCLELSQGAGANSVLRINGSRTDKDNYERLSFITAAGAYQIKPEAAGTGTLRNLHISGLPTSNPGPGILWNNAGTPAIGT